MSIRYMAFLRGINVSGRRVTKEQFVAPFEAAGFREVTTSIASGNVIGVYDGPAPPDELERTLELELQSALGLEVATFLRTAAEVAKIAADNRFPAVTLDDTHAVHVTFLKFPVPQERQAELLAAANDEDQFAFAEREFYWLRHGRMTDSTLPPRLLRQMSAEPEGTTRNMTTIRRLAAKFPPV